MKRFTTLAGLFSVSILAVWAISQIFTVSQAQTKDSGASAPDQPASNKAVIPVTGPEARKMAPVFDANGAVTSDPSGVILSARPFSDRKMAPVFDTNGAVVSDPSGTIWSVENSAAQRTDVMIAPVYDASGRLVSDPTGIIFASGNP
jgi:hypothetical protein